MKTDHENDLAEAQRELDRLIEEWYRAEARRTELGTRVIIAVMVVLNLIVAALLLSS